MADDLGLKGLRANILSARGALWAANGDPAGLDLLEESIRLFEELNMSTSQRSYNNLADAYYNLGDLEKATEATARMTRSVEAFRESRLASLGRQPGDQAPVPRRPLGGGVGAGRSPRRGGAGRAKPLPRRPLAVGAWAHLPRSRRRRRRARRERGRARTCPGRRRPAGRHPADSRFASYALWAAGDDGAETLCARVGEIPRSTSRCRSPTIGSRSSPSPWPALGRAAELEALAERVTTPTPWREGGLALARGDPLNAAAIFAEMGSRPFEAESRLLAAKQGLDADLPSAIDFFQERRGVRLPGGS